MAKCANCGKEQDVAHIHICALKKRGYVGAGQIKVYTAEQKFECGKCGAKVARAEYVCDPKPL
ncbi:MAG: hypothetical protein JXK94_06690 [Deltaproteobacteria bacterium]|nr:hypothetical protein [Deltaproteobacteria bacterium]